MTTFLRSVGFLVIIIFISLFSIEHLLSKISSKSPFAVEYEWRSMHLRDTPRLKGYPPKKGKLTRIKNFTGDQIFPERFCNHTLDLHLWLPNQTMKICTMPISLDRHVSGAVNKIGNWEASQQKRLFQFLHSSERAAFVDVGAHIGVYSLSAAKMGRQVFAFEPNKVVLPFLTESVAINNFTKNINIYPVALIDIPKCVYLTTSDKTNAGGSQAIASRKCSDKQLVPTARMDDLLPVFQKMNLTSAVVKIDVESMEPEVVLGGQQFLQHINVTAIQMEMGILRKNVIGKVKKFSIEKMDKVDRMLQILKKLKYKGLLQGYPVTWVEPSISSAANWSWDVTWVKQALVATENKTRFEE